MPQPLRQDSQRATKPTPGPWEARKRGTVTAIINEAPLEVEYPDHVVRVYLDEQNRCCSQFIAECKGATVDNSANARLIAAAPELLEALERLCNAIDGGVYRPAQGDWDKAESAIKKARGES